MNIINFSNNTELSVTLDAWTHNWLFSQLKLLHEFIEPPLKLLIRFSELPYSLLQLVITFR